MLALLDQADEPVPGQGDGFGDGIVVVVFALEVAEVEPGVACDSGEGDEEEVLEGGDVGIGESNAGWVGHGGALLFEEPPHKPWSGSGGEMWNIELGRGGRRDVAASESTREFGRRGMGLGRPIVTRKWTDYSCQISDRTDCDPITTGYGSRGCMPRRRAGKRKCFVFLSRQGDALERVFDKSNGVPAGRRSDRRCGGTNLNAQDQARESFNAIRRTMLALGRASTADEIAEHAGLPKSIVNRRLQSNGTANANPAFCWFARTAEGLWALTARGQEEPRDSSV